MDNLDILRIIGILKNKVYTGPRKVSIHLTDRCNLKCIYCWHHSPLKNISKSLRLGSKDLDFKIFKKIIDDCVKLKVECVELLGNGEPTLHPRFEDIVRYIKLRKLRLRVLTNGTFLKNIMLCLAGADDICINLSASNSTRYYKLHTGNSKKLFNNVIRNIAFFSKCKEERHKSPSIRINYILNSKNYDDFKSLFKLLNNFKLDCISIKKVSVSKQTRHLALSRSMMLSFLKTFKKIQLSNSKFSVQPLQFDGHSYHFSKKTEKVAGLPTCYIGWYNACINLNGDVTFCEHNFKDLIAGNVREQSFLKIWYSDIAMRIRLKSKYHLDKKKIKACDNCCHYELQQDVKQQLRFFENC